MGSLKLKGFGQRFGKRFLVKGLRGEVLKRYFSFFYFLRWGWDIWRVGFGWGIFQEKLLREYLSGMFGTNNFNNIFHFKMERYCWSVVVKRFWFYNFNRRFNWRGITIKGDSWKLLLWYFGLSTAKNSSRTPSDPTPTQIYLKNCLI